MGGSTERVYQKTAGKGSRSTEARLGETLFSWCQDQRRAGGSAQNQSDPARIRGLEKANRLSSTQSRWSEESCSSRDVAEAARCTPRRFGRLKGSTSDTRIRSRPTAPWAETV